LDKVEIELLLNVFYNIRAHPEYPKFGAFTNSVSFKSNVIRNYTREEVTKIIQPKLKSFINDNALRFPISVGYCINPANSISGSRAHQDPNLVDESIAYSLVFWIPLMDMNIENGTLQVVEGSHLWGNHIRSNFHVKWQFEPFLDTIIKDNLQPINVKAGDIICFDAALIHSSAINQTNKDRIAIQISTIPKSQNLVTVVQSKSMLFPIANYINIDEEYFTKESVWNKPSENYEIIKTERINYYYTKRSLEAIINEYKRLDSNQIKKL